MIQGRHAAQRRLHIAILPLRVIDQSLAGFTGVFALPLCAADLGLAQQLTRG